MNIILFGFKSSGKTYLGKLLSAAWKRPFIDTDDIIISLYKEKFGQTLPIHEIYQNLGNDEFRILEKIAILGLHPNSNAIIALGGGAMLDNDLVAYVQKIGQLVYLKASFDTILQRIRKIPAFVDAENPIESLKQVYLQRLPIYEAISAKCIDIDLLDEIGCIARIFL